jgi:16S rRNA processing protein RimM
LKLRGIDRIEDAETFRGHFLEIEESDRPELDEGEFYVTDLLGLTVLDEAGHVLGRIDEVVAAPAHDLLRVGELLIPFVSEFVLAIDRASGRITVRLLPGMLGEEP